MSPRVKVNQVMLFKRGMDMATGKNKKGKARSGGSQASVRHSGLEALESRVLFSAAPLVAELSGPKSADDGAASIEVALLPGDKLGADAGQTNGLVPTPPIPGLVPTPPIPGLVPTPPVPGLVPTPPGEAENQVPGLVPTPPGEAQDKDHKGIVMLGDIKGNATDNDIKGEAQDKDHKGFVMLGGIKGNAIDKDHVTPRTLIARLGEARDDINTFEQCQGACYVVGGAPTLQMHNEIWTDGTMTNLSEFPAKITVGDEPRDFSHDTTGSGTGVLATWADETADLNKAALVGADKTGADGIDMNGEGLSEAARRALGLPNTVPPAGWETPAELEALLETWEETLTTIGEDGQAANVDLQNMLQKMRQSLQMMSNVSKALSDTALSVIRKMN